MATCIFCGAQIPDNAKFCTACGAALPVEAESVQEPIEVPAQVVSEQPAADPFQQPAYAQPQPGAQQPYQQAAQQSFEQPQQAYQQPQQAYQPPQQQYQPPQQPYQQAQPTFAVPEQQAVNDSGSIGWGVLGAFFPLVGIILFFVWKNNKPKTAKVSLIGAVIGVVISLIINISTGVYS